MDIQSILRTTFAVPVIAPDWQGTLLLQLGASGVAASAHTLPPEPAVSPGSPKVSLDMGQGSREQQYSIQKPVLRLVPSTQ